jgi:hypothetical protein
MVVVGDRVPVSVLIVETSLGLGYKGGGRRLRGSGAEVVEVEVEVEDLLNVSSIGTSVGA